MSHTTCRAKAHRSISHWVGLVSSLAGLCVGCNDTDPISRDSGQTGGSPGTTHGTSTDTCQSSSGLSGTIVESQSRCYLDDAFCEQRDDGRYCTGAAPFACPSGQRRVGWEHRCEVPADGGGGAGGQASIPTSPAAGTLTQAAGAGSAGEGNAQPPKGCMATITRRESAPSYRAYEYDDSSRILSAHLKDSPDAAPTTSGFYRLDAAGRLLTYAGRSSGKFRHDYARDTAGNATSFVFVYEDWTDLTQPASAAPYMQDTFTHRYDESGRLVETLLAGSNYRTTSVRTYSHDAEGHCQSSTTPNAFDDLTVVTTYHYAEDRLAELVTEYRGADNGLVRRIVGTYRYDANGRLVAFEQDGGGHWAADADGTPDLVTYWTFESNGTWTVDQRDYTTDVPNDSIVVNGTARTCYRSLETYSSECNQLKARLPAQPSGLECRLDRGQMTLL